MTTTFSTSATLQEMVGNGDMWGEPTRLYVATNPSHPGDQVVFSFAADKPIEEVVAELSTRIEELGFESFFPLSFVGLDNVSDLVEVGVSA